MDASTQVVSQHMNYVAVMNIILPIQAWRPSLRWRHNGRDCVSNHRPHNFYSTVYSDADQSKHQSSASLAFVWGIHQVLVNSSHTWPVTRKMFPFDDVIMGPYTGYPKQMLLLIHCQYNHKQQYSDIQWHLNPNIIFVFQENVLQMLIQMC